MGHVKSGRGRGRTRKDAQDQHGVRGSRGRDDGANGDGHLGGLDHGERHGWILRTVNSKNKGRADKDEGRTKSAPKCEIATSKHQRSDTRARNRLAMCNTSIASHACTIPVAGCFDACQRVAIGLLLRTPAVTQLRVVGTPFTARFLSRPVDAGERPD